MHTEKQCLITKDGIFIDNILFASVSTLVNFNSIYDLLGISYTKFYKMDSLSQLCFIATELLLQNTDFHSLDDYEKCIYIETQDGCKYSDIDFWASTAELPSPAHFVYTLPNVMIGEICIRHKIKGENFCMVTEIFSIEQQIDSIKNVLLGRAKKCIHGWINFHPENFEARLFLSTLE